MRAINMIKNIIHASAASHIIAIFTTVSLLQGCVAGYPEMKVASGEASASVTFNTQNIAYGSGGYFEHKTGTTFLARNCKTIFRRIDLTGNKTSERVIVSANKRLLIDAIYGKRQAIGSLNKSANIKFSYIPVENGNYRILLSIDGSQELFDETGELNINVTKENKASGQYEQVSVKRYYNDGTIWGSMDSAHCK